MMPAVGVIGIIMMMILPVPAFLLDLALVTSIALSLTILIVSLYVKEVLDFSAFPSVLLAISLSGAMGAGAENTLLSLTLVFIPPVCRVSESVTTQVRGFDFVDAQPPSDGFGSRPVISREHHDPQTLALQLADSLFGGSLDRIGDGQQPRGPPID